MKLLANKIKLLLLFFFLTLQPAFSQLQSLFSTDTTLLPSNYFKTFFEKQYNIHQLNFFFDFRTATDLGDFLISQQYFGNLIEGVEENSGRDDENFRFIYSKNVNKFSNLFIEGNYILSSDSRAIGISKVRRLSGNLGINFFLPMLGNISGSLGYERNSQVQLNANGVRYRIDWKPEEIIFSEFNIKNSLNFEFLNLIDGRKNSDISITSNLLGIFPEKNALQLFINYKSMRRDFVVIPYFTTSFFDTRYEWKFFPSLKISYNIFENLYIHFTSDLTSYNVQRYYNKYDTTNQYSAVRKNLMEQTLTIATELYWESKIFEPSFGFSYYSRNEENSLAQNFQLPEGVYAQMVQFEAQKNNYQNRFNLYGSLGFRFSKSDTIRFTTSMSIFRYDTPSAINDDDRDELTLITKLIYSHSFNKSLTIKMNLDLLQNHLVFLKASRSSLNNWNRILRLSISPIYKSDFLRINSNFEVLANYTVYDFESDNIAVQSYIFRQFSYRDSIFINLNRSFYLFANIIYKIMERGTLYWKEFAMAKETSINEFFVKGLFFSKLNSSTEIGIGVRIYNIVQQSMGGFKMGFQYDFYSLSPETEIRIFLGKDKTIILQGWYELKFWNYKIQSKISNVSLVINYLL